MIDLMEVEDADLKQLIWRSPAHRSVDGPSGCADSSWFEDDQGKRFLLKRTTVIGEVVAARVQAAMGMHSYGVRSAEPGDDVFGWVVIQHLKDTGAEFVGTLNDCEFSYELLEAVQDAVTAEITYDLVRATVLWGMLGIWDRHSQNCAFVVLNGELRFVSIDHEITIPNSAHSNAPHNIFTRRGMSNGWCSSYVLSKVDLPYLSPTTAQACALHALDSLKWAINHKHLDLCGGERWVLQRAARLYRTISNDRDVVVPTWQQGARP